MCVLCVFNFKSQHSEIVTLKKKVAYLMQESVKVNKIGVKRG